MPKINQEEYEVLKGLDDKWKWIARDGECDPLNIFSVKPIKVQSQWNYMDLGYKHAELTKKENKMLQFIQWEDEEPYSIAELIEEYEFENVLSDKEQFEEWYHGKESEEAEVKNIEWLKEKIEEMYTHYSISNNFDFVSKRQVINEIKNLLDQLDEPEVLSQKWIDKNKTSIDRKLDGTPIYKVREELLQNLLVPKRELPVIPQFVADYIQEGKDLGCDLGTAMSVQIEILKGIKDYIKNNEESFARAWLDGYEVKEEKYIVELLYGVLAHHQLDDYWDVFDTGQIEGNEEWVYQFTEQEIKEYDERFWTFAVKVEELEE